MQAYCDPILQVGWFPHSFQPPGLDGVFMAKMTLRLRHDAVAIPLELDDAQRVSGDQLVEENPALPPVYPTDFVPRKAKTDLLLLASAYAPNKQPVRELSVRWSLGNWSKSLRIHGDRQWQMEMISFSTTAAQPFVKMPIEYGRALGGPNSQLNPIGIGYDTSSGPVPNIEGTEKIRTPNQLLTPGGFGPLGQNWKPRVDMRGTYGKSWEQNRWPWLPEDFNYAHFNSAPVDQQLDAPLRGDERLEFRNLHPVHTDYRTSLPSIQVRCHISIRKDGSLINREVPLAIDTLWIDLDNETAILVWRGTSSIESISMKEVEEVVFAAEPIDSRLSPADSKSQCIARVNPVEPEEPVEDDGTDGNTVQAEIQAQVALAEAEFAKLDAQAQQQLLEQGLDPKVLVEPKPKSLNEFAAELKQISDGIRATQPELAASFDEDSQELLAMQAKMDEDSKSSVELTRELVQEMAQRRESFAGMDLSELELFDLNLSGLDFSNADFTESYLDGCDLSYANLTGAKLTGADISEADFSNAILDYADLSECVAENTVFRSASINSTVFAEVELLGLDFSGVKGFGPDFAKSNLTEAVFTSCEIPCADFTGATLERANFQSASLDAGQLESVKAAGLKMTDAIANNMHASAKSDFTGADFSRSQLAGAIWEDAVLNGAKFDKCKLQGALFPAASLISVQADRVDFRDCVFEDADLTNAKITYCNLLRALMDRANLKEAKIVDSNLYNAGFWETKFENTDLRNSNVKGTVLFK